MKRIYFLLLSVLLASCTGAVQMLPEPSPTPTRTVSYRPTSTPVKTRTPVEIEAVKTESRVKPTRTPTPEESPLSMILLGASENVEGGGFSFRPIIGFKKKVSNREATLTSRDGGVIISLSGIPVHKVDRLEQVLDKLLGKMSDTIQDLYASDPYPVQIDGGKGLAVDLRGKLQGETVNGRLAIVTPYDELLFYALAFSVDGSDGQSWESRGQRVYDTVIRWIDFFEPQE